MAILAEMYRRPYPSKPLPSRTVCPLVTGNSLAHPIGDVCPFTAHSASTVNSTAPARAGSVSPRASADATRRGSGIAVLARLGRQVAVGEHGDRLARLARVEPAPGK